MFVTVPAKVIGRKDLGAIVKRLTNEITVLAEGLSLRGCPSDVLARNIS